MADFEMTQDDLEPAIQITASPPSGYTIDLTSATAKFQMRREGSTTLLLNADATIVDAATRILRYSWTGTDTDTAGRYEANFRVTLSSGKAITFPNDRYISILINPRIGE